MSVVGIVMDLGLDGRTSLVVLRERRQLLPLKAPKDGARGGSSIRGIMVPISLRLWCKSTTLKKRSVDKTGKPMAIHAKPTDLQSRVRK